MSARFIKHGPIGLDISSRHIAAAQLSTAGDLRAAVRFTRRSPDLLLSASETHRIRDVLDRNGFVGNQVVVGVPPEMLLWEAASLPARSSGAPIESLAHVELARGSSLDPDTLESQCWSVPVSARFVGRTQVITTGCSHEVADSYLKPFDEAGFQTIAFEPRPCAAAAACRPIGLPEKGIVALIDIGESSASPQLLIESTPVYSRTSPDIGLNALLLDIEQHLGFGRDSCQLLIDQISDPLAIDMDVGKATADVARHISKYLDKLSGELRTAIDYATYCYPELATHRVILLGEGARLPGVRDQVGQQIGLTPIIATPSRLIGCEDFGSGVASDPALVVALGLARIGDEA